MRVMFTRRQLGRRVGLPISLLARSYSTLVSNRTVAMSPRRVLAVALVTLLPASLAGQRGASAPTNVTATSRAQITVTIKI